MSTSYEKEKDNTIRRAAIYVRVSTLHQADKDSLPMQKNDLVTYANLILGIQDHEIFEDAGYSGKNTARPAFQSMMSKIRNGYFSHLLVWKIDRVSRNLLDFSQMYNELRKLNVTFVSKNEQFDTSTAIGEAMLKIILIFAELERNMTSERVTATMLSRASSGLWNGGKIPYGYEYNEDSKAFFINQEEAALCRLIKDDYLEHQSIIHTVRTLNNNGFKTRSGANWSSTSVWKILSNPFYAGVYRYNYRKSDGSISVQKPEDEHIYIHEHHPAIFSLDEHNLIKEIRENNARTMNRIGQKHAANRHHVFSDLLYCGLCGSRMCVTTGRKHVDGFRTSIYTCAVKHNHHTCKNRAVNDLVVGEFVINYVLNIVNAKTSFSSISSISDLQRFLLKGSVFKDVKRISDSGLSELYAMLSAYKADNSFVLRAKKTKRKKVSGSSTSDMLRYEQERQQRALDRLNTLYLYSESAMSEKDYALKKLEITSRLESAVQKLGGSSDIIPVSDEDFIKQASHLLISSYLKNRSYIYYKRLAAEVSPDILKEYMRSIIGKINVVNGRVVSITFSNGLTHEFEY